LRRPTKVLGAALATRKLDVPHHLMASG
jgi:hypothetical protein